MIKTQRKSNGEGSIYFDEKLQTWRAEIQWVDPAGKTYRKSFKSKKQTVVKSKLAEFKKQLLLNNGNFNPNEVTFREFATNWVENILKPSVKISSYARKVSTLENQVFEHLGDIPINKITYYDVQSMVNRLAGQGLSYSTIKKAFEAVSGCVKYYRIQTRIPFNPCEGVSLPQNLKPDDSDFKFFEKADRDKIVAESTRMYANGKPVYRLGWAFVLLMYSGMRIGELCALTWKDIDFAERTIRIDKTALTVNLKGHSPLIVQDSTKTKSGYRIIPMTQKAYDALMELRRVTGEETYIITSANHKQIRPDRMNKTFHDILTAIGIMDGKKSFGVHALRHTFASMLFLNGCEVKVVSEILGHKDTKVTENIYIHLIQRQKVKAMQDIDKYSI